MCICPDLATAPEWAHSPLTAGTFSTRYFVRVQGFGEEMDFTFPLNV